VAGLPDWPWSSMTWLMDPKRRRPWYDPAEALEHAGGLADTPAGRRKYLEWLAEDEPARRAQRFDQRSRGWAIGSRAFAKDLIQEQGEKTRQVSRKVAAWTRDPEPARAKELQITPNPKT
jgi:hypothetical protein